MDLTYCPLPLSGTKNTIPLRQTTLPCDETATTLRLLYDDDDHDDSRQIAAPPRAHGRSAWAPNSTPTSTTGDATTFAVIAKHVATTVMTWKPFSSTPAYVLPCPDLKPERERRREGGLPSLSPHAS